VKLVLGSSSPFRKQLLSKLGLNFITCSPDIDESELDGETPEQLVKRLSIAKAVEVAKQHPDALIIGSDQIALFNQQVIGKPGNHENAVKQLTSFSGNDVEFITGLCLYNATTEKTQYHHHLTTVSFRQLSAEQIQHYLEKDQPYQCAGSFRSESLGFALFSGIKTSDPDALIGLPMIKLVEMLFLEGIDVLY